MKVGLDLGYNNIHGILLKKNNIEGAIEVPIFSNKRDCNRVIMEKIMTLVDGALSRGATSIGISLPSKIDGKRGIVYDIDNIPHWKGIGIKRIIENKFKVPTFFNNDINCSVLGEKYYGVCSDFKDIVNITIGPSVGASVILNNKLFYDCKDADCLSRFSFNYVRHYRESYLRTIEELNFICESLSEMDESYHEILLDDLGIQIGRLISIMLNNYAPEIVVIGGEYAKYFSRFADRITESLERNVPTQFLSNLIIVTSEIENQKVLGAAALTNH